jgi:diguanylate cyclase (GGDEF)-like protein
MRRALFALGLLLAPVLPAAAQAPAVPQYQVDPFWPKSLPNRWGIGQAAGVATDARDHVWVIHRPRTMTADERGATATPPLSECCVPAPSVIEFDPDGNVVQAWGGPGHHPSWPESEHGIHVDHRDRVWIAGNGANDHVLRPIDPNELRARARNQVRRKWYQERLRNDLDRSLELAVTDPLTGLRNRRYVRRHLDGVLQGQDAAVMLLDVDRFKSINDTHGHAAGDLALKEVAERLKSHLRAADVLARYGGEEFMVVLAGAPTDYAAMVAERLRLALSSAPIAIGALSLPVTVSIGLAVAPAGCSVGGAIAAADAALYRAKANGRNRVEPAVPEDFVALPPGDE